MKRITSVMVAMAVIVVFSATAAAQQPVEYKVTVKADVVKGSPADHFVTFDGPVIIPDATLEAGTYVFTMLPSGVVQVSNADRSQQLAMFFTAPVQRLEPAGMYEVTLVPTAGTATRRIAKWFLPNQSLGFEFLYPSDEGRGER